MGVLTRAEHVEVSETDRLDSIDPAEADAVPLGSQLRDGIGRNRVRGLALATRQLAFLAVDGRRRCKDDPPDTLVARREQNVKRAVDVHRTRGQWILHG